MIKSEEINIIQRNIHFTRLKEAESEIKIYQDECYRLAQQIEELYNRPTIDPYEYERVKTELT